MDNPSGYPPLVAEENESKLKKRRKKREGERGETSNRKRRGEDVGEKWTMHVSQSREEIRRRDPADA